jgi:endonuclease/exonuclease/phosphatase family metal-dependent hydrolase
LDTDGSRKKQAEALAGFLRNGGESLPTVVAGDLNSLWGRADGAYKKIRRDFIEEKCGKERTNVWPLRLDICFGWWRGRIDFVFSNSSRGGIAERCETEGDRVGSDHKPIILLMDLSARR